MSRRFALASLTGLILISTLISSSMVRTAERGWTPDLMLKVKRVGPVVPSPDGSRVAFVVSEAMMEGEKSEWISHIHVAASDGSNTLQLTRGDKSATSPRWSPDGQSIGFLSPRVGDKANVFIIRVAGGEADQVTTEKTAISSFEWSPDGKSIAFIMPEPKSEAEEKAEKEKRDARVIDENDKLAGLYTVPVAKNEDGKRPTKKLNTGNVHVTGMNWSPDSSAIVFSHQRTPKVFDQNDLSIVRVDGGGPRTVVATKADESDPVYSRDGHSIAYVTSDEPPTWGSTMWVRVVPAAGGAGRDLAKTSDEQPDILGWSEDDRTLLISEPEGTIGRHILAARARVERPRRSAART